MKSQMKFLRIPVSILKLLYFVLLIVITLILLNISAYLGFFAPDFTLRPELARRCDNMNTKEFIQAIKTEILENLKHVRHAPSVQMAPIPDDLYDFKDFERQKEEDRDPDLPVNDQH